MRGLFQLKKEWDFVSVEHARRVKKILVPASVVATGAAVLLDIGLVAQAITGPHEGLTAYAPLCAPAALSALVVYGYWRGVHGINAYLRRQGVPASPAPQG